MKLNTTRFGEIEVDDSTIITIPQGILGFPGKCQYVLLNTDENSPLNWLQSVDDENLAFVVTNPALFMPDYQIDINRAELADIAINEESEVILMVIVTVPQDPSLITANLKGPLLINSANNMGKQIIVDNAKYDIKYRLIQDFDIEEVV
jgi:flagellar assembly factor FliW